MAHFTSLHCSAQWRRQRPPRTMHHVSATAAVDDGTMMMMVVIVSLTVLVRGEGWAENAGLENDRPNSSAGIKTTVSGEKPPCVPTAFRVILFFSSAAVWSVIG